MRVASITAGLVVLAASVFTLTSAVQNRPVHLRHTGPKKPPSALAPYHSRYVGLYAPGVPNSYAGVTAFTQHTEIVPSIVVYYSGWFEKFSTSFASTVRSHGALPLIQINPTDISLAAIASGSYDRYLRSYAFAVRNFGQQVILSFGHEMNGYWYSWGYGHTSPQLFIAAWRHVVTIFRSVGARNVIWLWTVNIMHPHGNIPSPVSWWPGNAYVSWIGIDGYFFTPSSTFRSVFGSTIKAVRAKTADTILIAETGADPEAGKMDKIASLFAGVHYYGLKGFVWFDAKTNEDWRIDTSALYAEFHRLSVSPALRY